MLNLIFREYLSPSYEFNEEDTIGVYSLEYIRKALSLLAKTDGRIIGRLLLFLFHIIDHFAQLTNIERTIIEICIIKKNTNQM